MKSSEQEAAELLQECRRLKAKIERKEADFNEEMKSIRDKFRMKYTRLNQLAKQLKTPITNL